LIQENVNLAGHTTFGLDVIARHFCEITTDDELQEALAFSKPTAEKVVVLGGGSNIVFTRNLEALVIKPAYRGIDISGETVSIGAGENWHKMVRYCLEQGLSGIENLSLIPGTCGAAPVQNIGAYGQELAEVFVALHAVNRTTGEKLTMSKQDCQFGYRDSVFKNELKDQLIITGITLKLARVFKPVISYQGISSRLDVKGISSPNATDVSDVVVALRKKKLPDPTEQGNVGSFFKNPIISSGQLSGLRVNWPEIPSNKVSDGLYKIHAAWLIEQAGMKGVVVGGAMVSDQHSLVLVNLGNASSTDVLTLRDQIQSRVQDEFNILLEVEPTFY
jgi:UDP-N-acetylmuramate dehydrogenase